MLKVYNNSKAQERVCVQLVLPTASRGFIFHLTYLHMHTNITVIKNLGIIIEIEKCHPLS